MTLLENPYFVQWIKHNVHRINSGLDSKQALTIAENRIQRLSIGVANLQNERLARDARFAATNLWSRISNVH